MLQHTIFLPVHLTQRQLRTSRPNHQNQPHYNVLQRRRFALGAQHVFPQVKRRSIQVVPSPAQRVPGFVLKNVRKCSLQWASNHPDEGQKVVSVKHNKVIEKKRSELVFCCFHNLTIGVGQFVSPGCLGETWSDKSLSNLQWLQKCPLTNPHISSAQNPSSIGTSLPPIPAKPKNTPEMANFVGSGRTSLLKGLQKASPRRCWLLSSWYSTCSKSSSNSLAG